MELLLLLVVVRNERGTFPILLLVLWGLLGQGQQDHGELLARDLALLVVADAPQDRLLELVQVLGVVDRKSVV